MKSLFDNATYNEVIQRFNNLSPGSQRQWGKMDVAQMLTHCKEAFKVPLSYKKMLLLKYIEWEFLFLIQHPHYKY